MRVAFYKSNAGTWRDKLVSFYTFGPYSHVELLFSDGQWFSASPTENAVRYKIFPIDNTWTIVDIPVPMHDEAVMRTWCDGEVGCPYDWHDLVRFVVPFMKEDPEAWFCSEICMAAFQQIGLFKGFKSSNFSPNAFYRFLTKSIRISS